MINEIIQKLEEVFDVYHDLNHADIDSLKEKYGELGEKLAELEDEIDYLKDSL